MRKIKREEAALEASRVDDGAEHVVTWGGMSKRVGDATERYSPMPKFKLRDLCKKKGFPEDGDAQALIERLVADEVGANHSTNSPFGSRISARDRALESQKKADSSTTTRTKSMDDTALEAEAKRQGLNPTGGGQLSKQLLMHQKLLQHGLEPTKNELDLVTSGLRHITESVKTSLHASEEAAVGGKAAATALCRVSQPELEPVDEPVPEFLQVQLGMPRI